MKRIAINVMAAVAVTLFGIWEAATAFHDLPYITARMIFFIGLVVWWNIDVRRRPRAMAPVLVLVSLIGIFGTRDVIFYLSDDKPVGLIVALTLARLVFIWLMIDDLIDRRTAKRGQIS